MTMRLFSLALLSMALLLVGLGAPAAQAADVKIAVVDLQRVLSESRAGQDIQKQIDTLRDSFQTEVSKQEDQLRAEEQALTKAQGDQANAELIQKKADFEKRLINTRQSVQDKRRALEAAAIEAVAQLRTAAVQVIGETVQKQKYDVVLNRQTVIMAAEAMDITDEVMTALNAKVTKIEVKVGGAPKAAEAKPATKK